MKLEPWQEQIVNGIMQGREIKLMMAGRRTGKSMFSAQALQRLWDDITNRPIEDLVLDERKFAGARFYTVEPVGGNWLDMETWCVETFGEAAEVWDLKSSSEQFIWPQVGRWYKNDRRFWFRHEKDRTLFILKWSR